MNRAMSRDLGGADPLVQGLRAFGGGGCRRRAHGSGRRFMDATSPIAGYVTSRVSAEPCFHSGGFSLESVNATGYSQVSTTW
jgi:hypothetical protein